MNISVSLKGRKSLGGTTILESLFAVVMAGITATSMFAGMTVGLDQVDNVRKQLRATQILSEKFETIRLYSWDQINEPGFIPSAFEEPFVPGRVEDGQTMFKGTLTISDPPDSVVYTNDVKLVTIDLVWSVRNVPYTNSLSTIVSQYGVQNYVY